MIENLPLPSNAEAERFTLHCLMDDDGPDLLPRLNQSHFSTEGHRILFETIAECFLRYATTERATVCNRLKETARLDAVGGLHYVIDLSEGLPHLTDPEAYLAILERYRERRELIRLGQWCHDAAFLGNLDPAEIKSQLQTGVEGLSLSKPTGAGLKSVTEIVDEAGGVDSVLNPTEDGPLVTFGPLARMIPRWERGRTCVIAAPTGAGKSSLARQEALGVSEAGGVVAVFSHEMSKEETLRALACTRAEVNARKLQLDRASAAERGQLLESVGRLEQSGLFIADAGISTVAEMAAEIRKLKKKRGAVDLVIVDYLQLVKHLGRTGTRTEAVDAISRGLKALAMAEKVPILALAQFSNKGSEAVADGAEPGEFHIRESGSISQDADRIVFLLPKKLEPGYTPEIRPYRLIVKKTRNGPQGAVEIGFDGALTRFIEVAV
jgi:replicative DNA helicase